MRSPKESIKDKNYCPKKLMMRRGNLSPVQLEAFPEEYMALLTAKEIPKKNSLRKLCPWLDDQGV